MLKSKVLIILALGATVSVAACEEKEGPDNEVFVATLNGASEVPANTSTATGTAKFTVNSNRTITYNLTANGMTPTMAHIHGPITTATGVANPVVDLTVGTNQTLNANTSFTRGVTYDSVLVLLRNNRAYVNVHSANFPNGEIRGNTSRQ